MGEISEVGKRAIYQTEEKRLKYTGSYVMTRTKLTFRTRQTGLKERFRRVQEKLNS